MSLAGVAHKSCAIEVRVSDGDARQFGSDEVWPLDDISKKGQDPRVLGATARHAALVPLVECIPPGAASMSATSRLSEWGRSHVCTAQPGTNDPHRSRATIAGPGA